MSTRITAFFATFGIFCFIGNAFSQVTIKRQGRDIFVQLPEAKVEDPSGFTRTGTGFQTSRITVPGIRNTSVAAHAPSLPQMSFILRGKPSYLKVKVKVIKEQTLEDIVPSPGQPTQVREGSFQVTDRISKALYEKEVTDHVDLRYLGDFRGDPLTRIKVNVAKYSAKNASVSVAQELEVTHNSREYRFKTKKFNKYLIIVPEHLRPGLETFIAWKESKDFIVAVEEVQSDLITSDTIKEIVAEYYKKRKIHFVMLIGTEKLIPTNYVHTGFTRKTPSDLHYFTFGGKGDYIPDVFFSRLVVETPEQLQDALWKSIRYESGLYSDTSGYQKIIGVASNEGRNPSDNEYIMSIGDTFSSNYHMLNTHFYQKSTKSNWTRFNRALNQGATWLTYMGHGNGSGWPSFNLPYNIYDIEDLQNQDVVQPVIIDIACQNGTFKGTDFIGSKMMSVADEAGSPMGAVAYYGGSVNISWHPPAIMAKGMAIERMEQGFNFLGEGLLLGQLYLAKNWDRERDVVDNMEWFHLQGDPGLQVRFDQRR